MRNIVHLNLLCFQENYIFFFNRCTVHSDIHTVHSPTDAHLLKH